MSSALYINYKNCNEYSLTLQRFFVIKEGWWWMVCKKVSTLSISFTPGNFNNCPTGPKRPPVIPVRSVHLAKCLFLPIFYWFFSKSVQLTNPQRTCWFYDDWRNKQPKLENYFHQMLDVITFLTFDLTSDMMLSMKNPPRKMKFLIKTNGCWYWDFKS